MSLETISATPYFWWHSWCVDSKQWYHVVSRSVLVMKSCWEQVKGEYARLDSMCQSQPWYTFGCHSGGDEVFSRAQGLLLAYVSSFHQSNGYYQKRPYWWWYCAVAQGKCSNKKRTWGASSELLFMGSILKRWTFFGILFFQNMQGIVEVKFWLIVIIPFMQTGFVKGISFSVSWSRKALLISPCFIK